MPCAVQAIRVLADHLGEGGVGPAERVHGLGGLTQLNFHLAQQETEFAFHGNEHGHIWIVAGQRLLERKRGLECIPCVLPSAKLPVEFGEVAAGLEQVFLVPTNLRVLQDGFFLEGAGPLEQPRRLVGRAGPLSQLAQFGTGFAKGALPLADVRLPFEQLFQGRSRTLRRQPVPRQVSPNGSPA